MKLKTWQEVPVTVHYDVEIPDPEVGVFSTSITINEITLCGRDIMDMFTPGQIDRFESDALEEYFDEIQENEA